LKYQRSTTFGCKDIEVRKSEFVSKDSIPLSYQIIDNSHERDHDEIQNRSRDHDEIQNRSRDHDEIQNRSRDHDEIQNQSRVGT